MVIWTLTSGPNPPICWWLGYRIFLLTYLLLLVFWLLWSPFSVWSMFSPECDWYNSAVKIFRVDWIRMTGIWMYTLFQLLCSVFSCHYGYGIVSVDVECFMLCFCISGPVTCVTLTRDGQCVLTSSLDNTLRLLDKESGELLNEWGTIFWIDCLKLLILNDRAVYLDIAFLDSSLCPWYWFVGLFSYASHKRKLQDYSLCIMVQA